MSKDRSKVIKKERGKMGKIKDNSILKNIVVFVKSHQKIFKIVITTLVVVVLALLSIIMINNAKLNKKVITINGEDYTRSDFMVYFYSVKYNYFGGNNTNISKENLKVIYDTENNITVFDHLKSRTLQEIETSAAVKKYASDNNIELNREDYKIIKEEKEAFIKRLGGKNKFNKILKKNNTTEKSYNKMAETDRLYNKIVTKLYGKDKRYDLTEEEVNVALENYNNEYYKIEQIILTTIDITTRKSLSDTEINQKKTLADTIYNLATNGDDFEELIRKYSEDAVDKEPPYYVYYKKGELLDEIEEAIVKLDNNNVSLIQTKYAFHIVKRLELDDSKYEEYLDTLREEKALKALNDTLGDLKIIYHDAYKKIKL